MLAGAIIGFGPLMVTTIMGFMVAPVGLVWSPFAALITSRMARNRGLEGGRYALVGATSCVFLLLPWLLLVIGLRGGRIPPVALRYMYIFVHMAWLLGPIVTWGQFVASLEFLMSLEIGIAQSYDLEPPNPVVAYSGFGLMVTAWVVSVFVTAKVWNSRFSGEIQEMVGVRYMIPFVGALACTLVLFGYLITLPD